MRFHWFAEATYPYLDREMWGKFPSGWVTPSRSLATPELQGEALNAYLRMYEYAAEVGFDTTEILRADREDHDVGLPREFLVIRRGADTWPGLEA